MKHFSEEFLIVTGFAPTADIFNANPVSDVVNLKKFGKVTFLFEHVGGTTGTGKLQVQAVDNASSSNAVDLDFRYAKKVTGASDSWGAVTAAAAATGVTTVAAESAIYCIEVDAAALPDAQAYVQLKLTEVVNDPVTGAAQILLGDARYGAPFATALT
jgi:hypothetical protein